jgi:hypothetical protein
MSNAGNGGRSALAGYLYQIVGALGMKAEAHCPDAPRGSDELDALLTLVGNGDLHHEYLDQDAVIQKLGIESSDEYVLVQFKYSRQVPPPTIGPMELKEIINRLIKSANSASNAGQNVTGYALVTNRRLGDKANDLRQSVESEDLHPPLTRKEQVDVLQQLRIVTELSLTKWDSALKNYAQKLGSLEREVKEGIDKLIVSLVRQTVDQSSALVTEANLIEAFTGCQDARFLTPESIVKHSKSHVEKFPVGLPTAPVRRKILDEIAQATSERALVILSGLGGCGKTVTLWQWASELTTSSPPGTGAYTTIELASDISCSWIAETICEWRNLPRSSPCYSEQTERALKRLREANPDLTPPVIHLGLDGLDEEIGSVEQEHIVKETLRWFWNEDQAPHWDRAPCATLVVTCRNPKDLVNKWLKLDQSGFPYSGELPKAVEINEFSSQELAKAAQQTGIPEIYDRIKRALQSINDELLAPSTIENEPALFGAPHPFRNVVDEQVLEAIKHPAMWRALLQLDEKSRLQVLDGAPQAVRNLAKVFINRFCKKVLDRGQASRLGGDELLDVLHKIALCCQANKQVQQSKNDDWIDPACETDLVIRTEARGLYSEAISGGIIIEDDLKHWRWRHDLVRDYLAEVEIG